ncbi:MAG: MATE family efflux transporter [Helicobacteraceae bacterium]|nr:MATE family efflux transporter [Helicobacteraceae bacterium]
MPFFCKARFSRVVALALPAALGALIDMTQVLIDFYLVKDLEIAATAAIGVAVQFMGLFYVLMGVFYIGSNAMMSRFFGAGDPKSAAMVYSTFSAAALLFSVPSFLAATALAEYPFELMGVGDRVIELGGSYLFVMAFALPSMMLNQIAFSAFSAAADIKKPLMIKIFSNAINIVLSYTLIFGVEPLGISAYGVAGAAAATVVAFYIETACYFYLIVVKKRPLSLILALDRSLFWRGVKIGIPGGAERLFTYGAFLIFMRIIAAFGDSVMTGYQVGLRVESLVFTSGIGFTIAAMSLTGRALGAKNPEEAEKDALFTAFLAAVVMGAAGVLIAVFARDLAEIFRGDDEAVIEAAVGYLICVGISQIPLGVSFVLSGAFRGAGDTKTSFYINFTAMCLFRIIPSIILAKMFDNIWPIWLAMAVETWLCGFWLYFVFKRGRWKLIKV